MAALLSTSGNGSLGILDEFPPLFGRGAVVRYWAGFSDGEFQPVGRLRRPVIGVWYVEPVQYASGHQLGRPVAAVKAALLRRLVNVCLYGILLLLVQTRRPARALLVVSALQSSRREPGQPSVDCTLRNSDAILYVFKSLAPLSEHGRLQDVLGLAEGFTPLHLLQYFHVYFGRVRSSLLYHR